MKLQWLPKPDARGGWDEKEFTGFDRFGTEKVSVLFSEYLYEWRIVCSDRTFGDLKEAQLAAENELGEEEK